MRDKLKKVYYKNYKKLFILPIVLVLVAFIILSNNYVQTGDFINKDVSLSGGTTVTIYTDESFPTLEEDLKTYFPDADFFVRVLTEFGSGEPIGVSIEVSGIEPDELEEALQQVMGIELTDDNFSVEFVGSSLGDSFYKQMLIAILLALLFMAIVVFVTFRMFVPSMAVVFAAFSDMICTLALLSLFDMRLSTAGIAAVLLLIGYSIDTDILMTTKILKRREGGIFERLYSSMKTGLTMSATTIVALTVAYFVATSLILKQMFLIIIIGLLFDIIMTYSMNAGLLIWYAKKRRMVD